MQERMEIKELLSVCRDYICWRQAFLIVMICSIDFKCVSTAFISKQFARFATKVTFIKVELLP